MVSEEEIVVKGISWRMFRVFSLKKILAVGWMHLFGKLPMIVSLLCVGVISKDSVYGRFQDKAKGEKECKLQKSL